MKAFLVLAAALLLALAGCGGSGSPGSKLEHALAGQSKAVCDGDCKTFHATRATCAGGRSVGDLSFYRCRIDYDNGGGSETVCAAFDGSKAVVRPLSTCKS